MKTAFVVSVFDMVNVGDVDVVHQAAKDVDRVEARVLSDDHVFEAFGREPVIPADERLEIIGSVRAVSGAAIYDPHEPLKANDRTVVYGRANVSAADAPVDHWLKPRFDQVGLDGQGVIPPTGTTTGLVGYVPGAWDMFHVGHLNILRRARENCDHLVVGAVTDDALYEAKGKYPVVPLAERLRILAAMELVDAVVVDFSSSKLDVWNRVHFDVLFKGDDWQGTPKGSQLESEMSSVGAAVHYFPYTPHVSSTSLRRVLATR